MERGKKDLMRQGTSTLIDDQHVFVLDRRGCIKVDNNEREGLSRNAEDTYIYRCGHFYGEERMETPSTAANIPCGASDCRLLTQHLGVCAVIGGEFSFRF